MSVEADILIPQTLKGTRYVGRHVSRYLNEQSKDVGNARLFEDAKLYLMFTGDHFTSPGIHMLNDSRIYPVAFGVRVPTLGLIFISLQSCAFPETRFTRFSFFLIMIRLHFVGLYRLKNGSSGTYASALFVLSRKHFSRILPFHPTYFFFKLLFRSRPVSA